MSTATPAPAHDTASFGPFHLSAARRLLLRGEQPIAIGGRALDILIALVEQSGQIVSRRELIERVWPDVIVEEANLRVHLAGLRKLLGDGKDGARYITNVPGRGYCFVAPIQRSGAAAPPLPRPVPPPVRATKLPAPLARMIGRQAVVETLRALVLAQRFVSVVAPGGIGKTTVAVAVAHAMLHDFEDAICFVDLGAVTDAGLVVSAVASAVGSMVQTQDPLPGLLSGLAERRVLIVLDNCEHVIEAVASLAERVFGESPQVHILTTSREPLRVEGENIYRLLPLETPTEEHELSASAALAVPAVQLFMERAAASGHRIELTDADAPTVAGICRRLDGIALAIELAASRVGTYGIHGMAELLGNRFNLLWQGRRTALPRHQTLQAMLDWSYNLLSPTEQTVLCRLSVFAGHFSLDGALAVGSETSAETAQTADAVAGLIDKSLIWTATLDGTVYYRLLDTTRAYAAAKLEARGELPVAARRQALHYVEFLKAAQAGSIDGGRRDLSSLSPHLGSVRVALEWSLSPSGDAAVGVRLAAQAAPLFLALSLLAECERWCGRALAILPDADCATETQLTLHVAVAISAMFTRGNGDEVRAMIEHGLALAESLSARQHQLQLLAGLNIYFTRISAFRDALAVAERIRAIAREIDDQVAQVMAEWMVGVSHHLIGDQAAAQLHCERGLAFANDRNIQQVSFFRYGHRVRALVALSRALWLRGQPERALKIARQVIGEAAEGGHAVDLCIALIYSIPVFIWTDRFDEAEPGIERLLVHAAKNALGPYHAVGLAMQGEMAVLRGDTPTGIGLLRQALTTLRVDRHTILTSGFHRALAEALARDGQLEEAAATIAEAVILAEQSGGTFDLPDLLRAQAEIGLSGAQPDRAAAEALLLRSIECASMQSAPVWQLRSAIPLARLWAAQGRDTEAGDLLTGLRAQFHTAPATIDSLAARAVREDPTLFTPLQR